MGKFGGDGVMVLRFLGCNRDDGEMGVSWTSAVGVETRLHKGSLMGIG